MMAMPDDEDFELSPQDEAAQDFMQRKGLDHIQPYDVQQIEAGRAWIYRYHLPRRADLELRVRWSEQEQDWDVTVEDYYRSP